VRPPLRTPATEPRIPDHRPGILGAFRFKDFRLLWSGLLISNLGTWMQFTALGYEVVRLAPTTHLGALYVGYIGIARAVPVLVLSPFAGVVADRFPRRRVLLATNALTALFALLLALVIASHHAAIGILMLLSGCQAATQSFDAPARQSWVPLLVSREYVANAVGLNSLAFNAPAVIGPPLAGILIAGVGVSPCMYANAICTLAVVVALAQMKPSPASSTVRTGVLRSIGEGLAFLFEHPVLRWVVAMLLVASLLVRPYTFLLPAYAAHVVHTDARGLGWLMAATGAGAIGGALLTAAFMPQRRSVMWTASAVVLGAGTALLGASTTMHLSLAVLVVMGLGTLAFLGRVLSVYSMILLGLVPAGSLLLGSFASLFDLRETFIAAGAITAACALWIYFAHPRLRAV
jgi:MFS family permease